MTISYDFFRHKQPPARILAGGFRSGRAGVGPDSNPPGPGLLYDWLPHFYTRRLKLVPAPVSLRPWSLLRLYSWSATLSSHRPEDHVELCMASLASESSGAWIETLTARGISP
ncbi:hypothetical protein M408DRAFT_189146 [Serendipita vermifera MAFF 305830]|uniref:Uncharacterized protein n=1 Tax=Serendipita vermifera MAFF 305830 TaxID=933852 RepID=A0A0C3BN98_SERVB|nr:hypothetical protein M408DRAFT_189146 [Serendipita vermifera MAFF 305830]